MFLSLGLGLTRSVGFALSGDAAEATVIFGALTLAGCGGVRFDGIAADGVSMTGGGSASERWAIAGGALVPATHGVHDGDTVELLLDGAGRVMVTIRTIPGAFSVAPGDAASHATSLSQINAAFRAARFGERILCRSGDYGFARDMGSDHVVNIGHDGADDPLTKTPGDFAVDGPIVIEPHPGETPVFWNMVLGRMRGVTVRGVRAALSPHDTFGGAARTFHAPIAVFGPRNTVSDVFLDSVTIEGRGIEDWDLDRVVCYVSFHAGSDSALQDQDWDMPHCGIVSCTMSGGACDMGRIGGSDFRFENNVVDSPLNDGPVGNSLPMSGMRHCWNVLFRRRHGIVGHCAVESLTWDGAGGCVIQLESGGHAKLWEAFNQGAAGVGITEGLNIGFSGVRPTGVLERTLRQAREPVDCLNLYSDKATDQIRFTAAQLSAVQALIGSVNLTQTIYDRNRTRLTEWLLQGDAQTFAGTIATPGLLIGGSAQHLDFSELRADRSTSTGSQMDDIHHVGNIYITDTYDWLHPTNEGCPRMGSQAGTDLTNFLNLGNIVVSARYPDLIMRGDGINAFNIAVAPPWSPYGEKNESASRGVGVRPVRSDSSSPHYFFANLSHNNDVDGTNGSDNSVGVFGHANHVISSRVYGAEQEAFLDANFQTWPRGDVRLSAAEVRALLKPKSGAAIGETWGPWGAGAAIIDPDARTYSKAAAQAIVDAAAALPRRPVVWTYGDFAGTESDPLTISTGADRMLLALVVTNQYGKTTPISIAGVTWGAPGRTYGIGDDPLTEVAPIAYVGDMNVAAYALANPPAGAGTLMVDAAATTRFAVAILEVQGVDQILGDLDIGTEATRDASSNTLTVSLTVTAQSDVVWFFGQMKDYATAPTITGDADEIVEIGNVNDGADGVSYALARASDVPAGVVSAKFTGDHAQRIVGVGLAIHRT